jgi:hypothetical protein
MGQKIDLTQQVQNILPEANGGAGPNIGERFSDAEVPSGAVNGSNVTFTLLSPPNPPFSLLLFLSKVLQIEGIDYTLSGSTITMTVAPASGSFIAWYQYLTFAMSLSFSDQLLLSDRVFVDAPVAQLPLQFYDTIPMVDTESLSIVMSPCYFAEAMMQRDRLIIVAPIGLVLSDSGTMSDAFSSFGSFSGVVVGGISSGVLSDQLVMSDAFTLGLSASVSSEVLVDQLALTDALRIGYSLANTDQLVLLDQLGLGYGEQFTDQLALSDLLVIGIGDQVLDQLVLSDALGIGYVDLLMDTLTLSDASLIRIGVLETLIDQLPMLDSFGIGYGEQLTDVLGLSDQFSLAVTSLLISDTLTLSDAYRVGYGYADVLTQSDAIVISIGLGIRDTLSLLDKINFTNGSRNVLIGDRLIQSDVVVISIGLKVADALVLSEAVNFTNGSKNVLLADRLILSDVVVHNP